MSFRTFRITGQTEPRARFRQRTANEVNGFARLYWLRAVAAAFALAVAGAAANADPWSELAQARRDLAISEQVQERLAARLEIARSDPATGPEQRRQLEEYAARVRALVALNRERVRRLAQSAGAAPGAMAPAAPGSAAAPLAKTHAEEVAALDAGLGSSLAEFDQLLLEEARRAKNHGMEGGGAGTGAGGGAGTARGGTADSKSSSGNGRSGENKSGEGSPGGRPAAGERQSSPGGRIAGADPGASGAGSVAPPDVGDGRDDDIVARQIRRAAESEPDPELRKKLWDEYRKYRQGMKG
jgi:hypothetical protein